MTKVRARTLFDGGFGDRPCDILSVLQRIYYKVVYMLWGMLHVQRVSVRAFRIAVGEIVGCFSFVDRNDDDANEADDLVYVRNVQYMDISEGTTRCWPNG